MAKSIVLRPRTRNDIDAQVERLLLGIGSPDPPLDLRVVRDHLELSRGYYSSEDPSLIQGALQKLTVGAKQVFKRPELIRDAIMKFDLRALYLPDQKRILIDKEVPKLKHRWNEAHEVLHHLIPWHEGTTFGDSLLTLVPSCHEQIEAEANYGAGRLLFLQDRFTEEARFADASLDSVQAFKSSYENTLSSTLWRCVEVWGQDRPVLGMITGHPHPSKRKPDFDPLDPCKHIIQSEVFAEQFSQVSEIELFAAIEEYCGAQRAGPLGRDEIRLRDDNGEAWDFVFETFFNSYEALTLGVCVRQASKSNILGASSSI